ncbi:orotidine-5'-phosphate decarboxylase [soil metagenome]
MTNLENPLVELMRYPEKNGLIVGCEGMGWPDAKVLLGQIDGHVGIAKVHNIALKDGLGPAERTIREMGYLTMADYRLFDIESTVKDTARIVTECGVSLMSVQASGGEEMLSAAVAGRDKGRNKIKDPFKSDHISKIGLILASTVPASFDDEKCEKIYGADVMTTVKKFAFVALEAGVEGIICSAQEVSMIRQIRAFDGLAVVAESVTPEGSPPLKEHERPGTPYQVMKEGADGLIISRAVREGPHSMAPSTAARNIAQAMQQGREAST